MKYFVVLCDGMADEPIEKLGGLTPLEYANTPVMDMLANSSEIGMVRTVPHDMKPGSDTANLSVLGYDPSIYYSGRSPLEALSIGVSMKDSDIAIRTNLVTLTENGKAYEDQQILDHSSSEISTEEAAILLDEVRKNLENDEFKFYLGTSYRHLLIWDKGELVTLTAPHDILTQDVRGKLPENEKLKEMMIRSYDILKDHPINVKRKEAGLNPANSIWFWGAGTKPMLDSFSGKTHKKGAMISAVDLLKGIAKGAGMTSIDVEGATGGLNTNYKGKANAALKAVNEDGFDFAYVHVEATDEMGHQGLLDSKIKAIENIDRDVLGTIVSEMKRTDSQYRILVLPDHPTPVRLRTHTSDPVPYLLYDSRTCMHAGHKYNEREAVDSGILVERGHELINRLFEE